MKIVRIIIIMLAMLLSPFQGSVEVEGAKKKIATTKPLAPKKVLGKPTLPSPSVKPETGGQAAVGEKPLVKGEKNQEGQPAEVQVSSVRTAPKKLGPVSKQDPNVSREFPAGAPSAKGEEEQAKGPLKIEGLPTGWALIPGVMKHVDVLYGGDKPIIVGVDEAGKAFRLHEDWQGWQDIHGGAAVAFKQILVGGDASLWALSNENEAWRLDDTTWKKVGGAQKLQQLSVGNRYEVWGINEHSQVIRANINPDGEDTVAWKAIETSFKAISVASGGDGSTWAVGTDQIVYKLERLTKTWMPVFKPADFLGSAPARIALKDQYTFTFMDFTDLVWVRTSNDVATYELLDKRDEILAKKAEIEALTKEIARLEDPNGSTPYFKIVHARWGCHLWDPASRGRQKMLSHADLTKPGDIEMKTDPDGVKIPARWKVRLDINRFTDPAWGIGKTLEMRWQAGDKWYSTEGAPQEDGDIRKDRWWEGNDAIFDFPPHPATAKKSERIAKRAELAKLELEFRQLQEREAASWEVEKGRIKMKHAVRGVDGTIVGIDKTNRILVYQLNEKDLKRFTAARGPIMRGNQVCSIVAGPNYRFMPLWGHGNSPYDDDTTTSPNNHVEVLVGGPDTKKYEANFFTVALTRDGDSNEALKYGDEIEVFCEQVAPGKKEKAGAKGRSFKWWVREKHYKWGDEWNQPVVSSMLNQNTKGGFQKFKIVSPSGRKGTIFSYDIVQLVALAPHAQGRNVFVLDWSRHGDKYRELAVPPKDHKDVEGFTKNPFGARDVNGNQFFRIRVIKSAADVHPSAQEAYKQLVGAFKRFVPQEGPEEKIGLAVDSKDGIGVFREIQNRTAYPVILVDLDTTIPAQDALTGFNRDVTRPLRLVGNAKDAEIPDFGPGKMINLTPMWGRGFAWISRALESPGNMTLTFLAKTTDAGNIQVVMDNAESTNPPLRIIIGGWKNERSAILYNDTMLAEAVGTVNEFAKVVPGWFKPYWVTIHKADEKAGFIMVGAGEPGENPFMCTYIEDLPAFNRVGFSSHGAPVTFSEVKIGKPMVAHPNEAVYEYHGIGSKGKALSIPASPGSMQWLDQALRVPSEGTIAFTATARHSLTLVIENDEGHRYQFILGAANNRWVDLYRDDDRIASLNTQFAPNARVYPDEQRRFWVSIDGGRFLAGVGEIGEGLFFVLDDAKPLGKVRKVGFKASDHPQQISDVTFAPPVILGPEEDEDAYKREVQRFDYKGSMVIIRPFDYELAQQGQRVSLKDMVTGKVYHVIATPQQEAQYIVRMTLDAFGVPSFEQIEGPKESPGKIALERAVYMLHASADATAESSTYIQGQDQISMGVRMGLIGASTLLRIGASGAQRAIDEKFRSHDSYVHTEEVLRQAGAQDTIPREAEENKNIVIDLLRELQDLDSAYLDQLGRIIARYPEILLRINHPYVIQDPVVKGGVYRGLTGIVRQYKQFQFDNPRDQKTLYLRVLNLLIQAFSNTYLVDPKVKDDVSAKDEWYGAMIEIGSWLFDYILKNPGESLIIESLYGEYLWLPVDLAALNNGWVSLEIKGQADAFICFSQDDFKVRGTSSEIYEVVFGAWENTKHEIRVKSLGRAAFEVPKNIAQDSLLTPRKFKQYRVGIQDNVIYMECDGKRIAAWKDPFPWKKNKYIGISTWRTPIEIRAIETGTNQAGSAVQTDPVDDGIDDDLEADLEDDGGAVAPLPPVNKPAVVKPVPARRGAPVRRLVPVRGVAAAA